MAVTRHLKRPTRTATRAGRPEPPSEGRTRSCSALLPMGFTEPSRSPGLLVSSYLTVSPLPTGKPVGGLFSVALSLASRPVGVTHHRTLWSPDFPPAEAFKTQSLCQCRGQRSPGPLRFKDNRRTLPPVWQAGAASPEHRLGCSARWRPQVHGERKNCPIFQKSTPLFLSRSLSATYSFRCVDYSR